MTLPSPLHAFQSALLGFLRRGNGSDAAAMAEALRRFARERPRNEAELWDGGTAFYDALAAAGEPPGDAQRLWSTRLERQMRRSQRGGDLDPTLTRELATLRAALPVPESAGTPPPLPPQLAALAGLLGRSLDPALLAAWNAAGRQLAQAWNGAVRPEWEGLRRSSAALCAAATALAPEQPDAVALAVALADALERLEGMDGRDDPPADVRAALAATLEAFAEEDAPARPGFADRVAHLARRLDAIAKAPAHAGQGEQGTFGTFGTFAAAAPAERPFGSLSVAAEFAAEAAERLAELREALHRYPPDRHALALGAAELADEAAGHGLAPLAEVAQLLSRAVDFGAPDLESATVRARLESALEGMSGQIDAVAEDRWPAPLPRLAAALAAFVGEREPGAPC